MNTEYAFMVTTPRHRHQRTGRFCCQGEYPIIPCSRRLAWQPTPVPCDPHKPCIHSELASFDLRPCRRREPANLGRALMTTFRLAATKRLPLLWWESRPMWLAWTDLRQHGQMQTNFTCSPCQVHDSFVRGFECEHSQCRSSLCNSNIC